MKNAPFVPAQAGTQFFSSAPRWMPAFAGMSGI